MIQILAAFLLIAIVPFMFRDFRRSLSQTFLVPDVMPSITKMEGLGERTGSRYCWFEIPKTGLRLVAEISVERYESLKAQLIPATVIIQKLPFCRPEIVLVKWQGENAYQSADQRPSAVYAMVLYLLAGLGFMVWSAEFAANGQLFLTVSYLSALLLAMSGYAAMACRANELPASALKDAPLKLLGLIPMGRGRSGFMLGALLCLGATLFLFSQLNILTLFLGLNAAVSLGCLVYLALRA